MNPSAAAPEARAEAIAPSGPVERFEPGAPSVSAERVLRIQGYADLDRVRPVIRRAADAMARRAEELSRPRVAFRRVAVESLDPGGDLVLEGGRGLHCAAFPRQLAGCDEVVPFVLTVGAPLAQEVVDLVEKGDLLEGLLLEAAGWLAIEDATRQFKAAIRRDCESRGRRMTPRLGPGYSYKVDGSMVSWGLEEQPALFALLEGAQLPVTLMASCAMTPKMSRSGLYGTGPQVEASAPQPPRASPLRKSKTRGAGR